MVEQPGRNFNVFLFRKAHTFCLSISLFVCLFIYSFIYLFILAFSSFVDYNVFRYIGTCLVLLTVICPNLDNTASSEAFV